MFVCESKTATFSQTIFWKSLNEKSFFWCKETALLECEGCSLGWAGTQSGSHQQLHSQVLYSKWVGNYQTMKLKIIYKYIYWIYKIYHWSYFLNAISAKNIFSDYTPQKTQIWQIWPCGMWIKPWQLLMVQKTFTFAFGTIYNTYICSLCWEKDPALIRYLVKYVNHSEISTHKFRLKIHTLFQS